MANQINASIVLRADSEQREAEPHKGQRGRVLIVGTNVEGRRRSEFRAVCVFDESWQRVVTFMAIPDYQLRDVDWRGIFGGRGRYSAGDETLRSCSGVPGEERCVSEPWYVQEWSHYGFARRTGK